MNPTRTRLAEIRKRHGFSASELAKRVAVTRQTIYAIEDGSYVPNTAVALRLARVLEVSVEDLFSLEEPVPAPAKPMRAEILGRDFEDIQPGELVRLCRVGERVIAVPTPLVPAYLPPADALVEGRSGSTVSVNPLIAPDDQRRLLLAGCDPALSLLTDLLTLSGIEVISVPAPSRRALEWLKGKRVHAAGSHLVDHTTGEYNLPFVRRTLPKDSARVITFATWEEGLVIGRGNPKSINSIADLHRKNLTVINRETGSGSRDLLDTGLRNFGILPEAVAGYNEIAHGHLAAAYSVATGKVDCCVATRSAARRFGLDFIPLAIERFDLILPKASLDLPPAKALADLLNQKTLRDKLRTIAGYETGQTGRVQL